MVGRGQNIFPIAFLFSLFVNQRQTHRPVSFQVGLVSDEDQGSIVGRGQAQMLADAVQVSLGRVETAPLRDAVHHQVTVGPF